MTRALTLILAVILLSGCSGFHSFQLTSTQTATLKPTLHPSVTPFPTPTKTATLEPANTLQPTKEKTPISGTIFTNFIKYGYDKQFEKGLDLVNSEKGSYMVEVVMVDEIQYSKFDFNNLEVRAWAKVAWYDKDGNQKIGILPFVYLNKDVVEIKDGWEIHQYYILGTAFDKRRKGSGLDIEYLQGKLAGINIGQILSAYSDTTETISPGLAEFLNSLSGLPPKFVETGDPTYLPNVAEIGPVFPVTSMGFVK